MPHYITTIAIVAMISFFRRLWGIIFPLQVAKSAGALRIGLLGASNIAPIAIIRPAKSHPEVIVAAVAARDERRARTYAKKHGIPVVCKGYQELIDSPSLDAIYIPLPNGLHYEWTLKALKAGKHVLLEKPSVSNAEEAVSLFSHPMLSQPNAPVILEAFHVLHHPAFQLFLSLLDRENIATAHSETRLPRNLFPPTDIRFIYSLSGGTLLDLGTYQVLMLRQIFGTEPEECLEAIPTIMPGGYDQKCDHAFKAKWRFPNGGVGDMEADLGSRNSFRVPGFGVVPRCEVVHREKISTDKLIGAKNEHVVVKKVTMWNMMVPTIWHRIDIVSEHTIRNISSKATVKRWTEKESRKAYTWQEFAESGNAKAKGEPSWTTYRYQLEAFVNRIKGRKETGIWMDGEESVKQMGMIDGAYLKAGMDLRPTSDFLASQS